MQTIDSQQIKSLNCALLCYEAHTSDENMKDLKGEAGASQLGSHLHALYSHEAYSVPMKT